MLKRPIVIHALHLFALCSFAVAQPLYDLLAQNVEFFVAHRASGLEILLFVGAVSFGLPLILVSIEALVGLVSSQARRALHLLFVAALVGAAVLIVLNRSFDASPAVVLGSAAGAGLLVTLLYARSEALQRFCTIASIFALFFPVYLLAFTPLSSIFFPSSASARTSHIEATTPVVLVVFDEFSLTTLLNERKEIDAVRFPNFAALAGDAWWFRRATAIHPQTIKAVPAVLTGRLPAPKSVPPSTAGYPDNIFTWLGGSYRLNVSEPVTELCPRDACRRNDDEADRFNPVLFASDLTVIYLHSILPKTYASALLPPMDTGWNGFGKAEGNDKGATKAADEDFNHNFKHRIGADRAAEFASFVSRVDGSNRSLDFIHILLPHNPYVYLPNGKTYPWSVVEGLIKNDTWSDNQHLVQINYHQWLLQVGFVDKLLGDLIGKLKQTGKYDQALIIVTADHGRAIKSGLPKRRLVPENGPDLLHIPLFVKLPGQQEGKISDRPVSNLDILPTIADVLRAKIPWEVDGHSMVADTFPERGEITIQATATRDKTLTFDRDSVTALPRLPWQVEVFGAGTPLSSLRPNGPYSDLIGRRVDSLSVEEGGKSVMLVSDAWDFFRNVDLNVAALPVSLQGEVAGLTDAEASEMPLAIAVNGAIEAVSPIYRWEGKPFRISAMLPQTALKAGKNDFKVFLVRKDGDRYRLIPVGAPASEKFEIVKREDGSEILVSTAGRRIQVVPEKVAGQVDSFSKGGLVVRIRGWAADFGQKAPASEVLVFANGELVYSGPPNTDRPDVSKQFNVKELVRSGFSFGIPASVWAGTASSVRVFGVAKDGVASELSLGSGARRALREAKTQDH